MVQHEAQQQAVTLPCTDARVFPASASDLLRCEDLLSAEERLLRDRVREAMERDVAPVIPDYVERAEFPFELLPVLRRLNIAGGTIQGYGCPGLSPTAFGLAIAEVARVDCGLSTFFIAHGSLCMATIAHLGSEQHKRQLLPALANLDLIGAWALTEPFNGSDASGLQTTAKKVPGGWRLNGRKRWIGNAPIADVTVIWARNLETGQVNAFLVRKGTPGYTTQKMQRKASHRVIQNGDVWLKDVFVPDEDRLPGADSFQSTATVLAMSRVMVAWQPVGIISGVYDIALRYCGERVQFDAPLTAYQITQEKLVRMLSTCQAMQLLTWRLTKVYEQGHATPGMAAMVKAHNSLRGRETAQLGRELLGSNGLLGEFLVSKALADMEGVHSYEGTYEVNVLVAGREVTGYAAFKARGQKKAEGVEGSRRPQLSATVQPSKL